MSKITLSNSTSQLILDLEDKTFDLVALDGEIYLRGAQSSLDLTPSSGQNQILALKELKIEVEEAPLLDVQGEGSQLRLSGTEPTTGLKLHYLINAYPARPFFLLRMQVENTSTKTCYLNAFNLIEAKPSLRSDVLPDSKQSLDFFKVGWHDWVYTGLRHGYERDVNSLFILKLFTGRMLFNPATPIGKRRGEFWGENWGILSDGRQAILAGLVSLADQFGLLHAEARPGKGSLTLSSLADGIPLEPGERLDSEWGYLQGLALPVEDPMADYVEAVARQMKPRQAATPPPAMWTHWYYYFEHITQEQFLENLEEACRLKSQIPYQIFQLDGGYYKHWGDWLDWNERFPLGPLELSQRSIEKGFTPGIWLAPFVVDPNSTTARAHPEWLVQDQKGKPIRSGFFYSFYGNALDLTQEAVLDHIRSIMEKLVRELGYGFIKTDFVYAGALPGVRQDRKKTRAQAFRMGMQAIRQAIGDQTYLLGCGCPMGPAIGIVDAIRIGPDTCPSWDPFLWSTPWAKPLIKEDRSIASLRNNIRHTLNLSALHRRWWWNDPDCLMVRSDNTSLTREEVQSNFSLIGSNGNLMIHSDNLKKLSPEQIALAARLTPLLDSDGRALDLLEREMPELYVTRHRRAAGHWACVALFNWHDTAADKTLDLKKLGFSAGKNLHGFDFWQEKYFSVQAGRLEFKQIPAHGCKLLRFCEQVENPCLVGDTLHASQGGEIVAWNYTGNELQFATLNMQREVAGSIWLWLPKKPSLCILNGDEVKCIPVEEKVYRLPLAFTGCGQLTIKI